ncbi:MAG: hypothetical protein KF864_14370 [Phycisphaeraceae bacterium]|nr:hypothetical protein [Phycisphaeraceae bacterium]
MNTTITTRATRRQPALVLIIEPRTDAPRWRAGPRQILAAALRGVRRHGACRAYIFAADWSLLDALRQVRLSPVAHRSISIHHQSARALCPLHSCVAA